jgi:GntR family transcriptional regulator
VWDRGPESALDLYLSTSTIIHAVSFVTVDARHPTPLHAQLEHGIRAAIATGRLKPNDQLPTVRQLAVELQVNANTVARVYVQLERMGLLETRRGVGTFVAASQPAATPKRSRRDPELRALVRRCLDEAAAQGFAAHDVARVLDELAGQEGG